MDLQFIVSEIKKQLPEHIKDYTGSKEWKYYCSLYGFIDGDEDDYFDLYFKESLTGKKIIEISHTTFRPNKFVDMIMDIDPNAEVVCRTENCL